MTRLPILPLLVMLPLFLAGCDAAPSAPETRATPTPSHRAAAPGAARIPCARAGGVQLQPVCRLGRTASAEGLILTLRHPDGGFRRLLVTSDGRGVIAADGAQQAQVRIVGNSEIEVALAGDRYRLQATVRGAR